MEIAGNTYTVGADPEIFVGKDGKFISAHNLVSGTKEAPLPVDFGAVQVDGMALEFNIDPAATEEQFLFNLNVVKEQLGTMIGDLSFLEVASVSFTRSDIANVPMRNLELGCDPDYNGYDMQANPRPDGRKRMRTAGGHVHVGGFSTFSVEDLSHFYKGGALARLLDKTIGVYSVLWDKDDERRAMYGKAGAFRPKLYGMEYRTLSNAWIFNPKLVKFVYNGVREALEAMFLGNDLEYAISDDEAQYIINNSKRNSSFFTRNEKAQQLLAS